MRVIIVVTALTSLIIGGMALTSPRVFGSRSVEAAVSIDVPALQKATDPKQLSETEVQDLF